jgi:PTH1 family peptidyl-tRNA hydrolase
MQYIALGLGNPEEVYQGTRHNVGQFMMEAAARALTTEEWKEDTKAKVATLKAKIGKHTVLFVRPLVNMNVNGKVLPVFIKTAKDRERLVVFYDDMDLPLGRIKLSYGRSSGGHRGLESVIKTLKSKDFLRVRVGVSPSTPSGKLKKPQGEDKVIEFVLGKFKDSELEILKKERKNMKGVVETFVTKGFEQAMNEFN